MDQFASLPFILNDSQASHKLALGAEYNSIKPQYLRFQNLDVELATAGAGFLKLNYQRAQRINLFSNYFSFSYSLNCGLIKNLSALFSKSGSPPQLKTNDRLFLSRTHCFSVLGHNEVSNRIVDEAEINKDIIKTERQQDPQSQSDTCLRKVIMGDDLGSERYLNLLGRLDFCNIPGLRNYGLKPFIFGELIYYPPCNEKSPTLAASLKRYTRGGFGFGLSVPLPINEMLNLHIYQNIALFNASKQRGDIARNSMIEVEIGFF